MPSHIIRKNKYLWEYIFYPSMEIRELFISDIGKLSGLYETLSNLKYSEDIGTEKTKELLKRMMDCDIHLFVAIEGSHIVGTVSVVMEQKLIRGGVLSARIEEVATHPDYQGKGIATRILEKAIQYAKERKCYKVVLTCSEKLIPFYQRLGLEVNGAALKLYLETSTSQ